MAPQDQPDAAGYRLCSLKVLRLKRFSQLFNESSMNQSTGKIVFDEFIYTVTVFHEHKYALIGLVEVIVVVIVVALHVELRLGV